MQKMHEMRILHDSSMVRVTMPEVGKGGKVWPWEAWTRETALGAGFRTGAIDWVNTLEMLDKPFGLPIRARRFGGASLSRGDDQQGMDRANLLAPVAMAPFLL